MTFRSRDGNNSAIQWKAARFRGSGRLKQGSWGHSDSPQCGVNPKRDDSLGVRG
jgi:hypothetical protein